MQAINSNLKNKIGVFGALHHYVLVGVFFFLSLFAISLYGHLLKQLTGIDLVFSIFYFINLGLVILFTGRYFYYFRIKYKYIFL